MRKRPMHQRVYGSARSLSIRLVSFQALAALALVGCGRSGEPPAAPAKAPHLEGKIDRVDDDEIEGWAWDRNHPGRFLEVNLYEEDTLLATVRADQFRQSLFEAGVANGTHGFRCATPAGLKDGRSHTVRLRVLGSDNDLAVLKMETSEPEPDPGPRFGGSFDGVDVRHITGWAWNANRPDSPVDVDLYDGDKLLATIRARHFRHDLRDAGAGNGKHGFIYPTPSGLKDGKPHTLRVKITGSEFELDGSPKAVTLRP
jgi:hypothetical protein